MDNARMHRQGLHIDLETSSYLDSSELKSSYRLTD